jgi:hypothetical protein
MVGGERGGSHDRTASGINRLRYASDASGTSRATHRVSKKHEEEEHIHSRRKESRNALGSSLGRRSQLAGGSGHNGFFLCYVFGLRQTVSVSFCFGIRSG